MAFWLPLLPMTKAGIFSCENEPISRLIENPRLERDSSQIEVTQELLYQGCHWLTLLIGLMSLDYPLTFFFPQT